MNTKKCNSCHRPLSLTGKLSIVEEIKTSVYTCDNKSCLMNGVLVI